MDASIVSVLALFLLVSFSDPGAVDAHVNVDTACRNVSAGRVDYAFCVSVLRAVPNNTESDFRSLAFYASKFALDNYTHTIDVASRLIGSSTSTSSRAGRRQDGDGDGGDEDERRDALKQCVRYYTVGTHALQLAIDKIGYPDFTCLDHDYVLSAGAGTVCNSIWRYLGHPSPIARETDYSDRLNSLARQLAKSIPRH